jgi:iron complex transport system permease protein
VTTLLTKKRFLLVVGGYLLVSAGLLAIAPFFGSESIEPAKVLHGLFSPETIMDSEIFFFHRIPRVLLAFLVGGSLAVAGNALQVVLKNPLAEPFILGIAGGGALGAVVAISIPGLLIRIGPFSSLQVFSLLGCLLCVWAIYRFSSTRCEISMTTILLAGVTVNILCGATILLIRYLVSPHLLVAMDRWMMGGLDVVGYGELSTLLPLLLPGLFLIFIHGNSLNQLALGTEMALGHGVEVGAVHKQVLFGTGLASAAAVSLAGPIGFVGLIIPHMVRRLSGSDHRIVLPAAFCTGGAFLTLCDVAARTLVAPTEMPVGIITALVGGPVFLKILFKKERLT